MANNYPYYPWQPTMPTPQPAAIPQGRMAYMGQPQIGIKGRPVSSIEEVKAASIDFDGSIFYFPDLANRKIYTKQINFDGTPVYNVYELKNIPVANESSQYITRDEFEAALAKINEKITMQPTTMPEVPTPVMQSQPMQIQHESAPTQPQTEMVQQQQQEQYKQALINF